MSVVILGAGALGHLVQNILTVAGNDVIAFYDDNKPSGKRVADLPVRGDIKDVRKQVDENSAIIAIGEIETRRRIYSSYDADLNWATAVHPSATLAETANIGSGTIIKEQAVIEPNVDIGKNVIVGNNTVVCHDTIIGDHCRLGPSVSIAGDATIETGAYLAVNVSIDRTVCVGKNTVVASGCTVWDDVPEGKILKLPKEMTIDERH